MLWDAIFSKEDKNERYPLMFIDYIAIAMLIKIRKNRKSYIDSFIFHIFIVINEDQSSCFQNLFSYPDSDIKAIIELADKIKQLFVITIGQNDYDKNYIRDQLKKLKENNLIEKQKEKNQLNPESQTLVYEGQQEDSNVNNKSKKYSLADLFKNLNNDLEISKTKTKVISSIIK